MDAVGRKVAVTMTSAKADSDAESDCANAAVAINDREIHKEQ
jgi:hypothetical protein